MPVYNYHLGTSDATSINVEAFTPALNPPRSRLQEAAAFVDKLDGSIAGLGSPACVWAFDILTQAQVDALRVICPGYSATVWISTRQLDGTFGVYTGTMVWPVNQLERRNFNGRYLGLEFQFRTLTKLGDVLTDSDGAALTDSNGVALYA